MSDLSYEITFLKARWRKSKSERVVLLPAPVLFNLNNREGWSLTEEELDTYLGELSQQEQDTRREVTDDSVKPSNEGESSYQQPAYDWGASSSSHEPNYDHSYQDPPAWNPYSYMD